MIVLVALVAGALPALAGCGQGIVPGSGPPAVVAAESTWGSIASQLGGTRAPVQSIITNPAEDPHAYEPTAVDARTLATASLVIVNGAGYDPWASRLLAANPTPGRIVLDVGRLLHVGQGGNPHRWYDPADVRVVAGTIAADLERLDPRHRAAYRAALARFEQIDLARYERLIRGIRARYAGVPVGASESIFALLAPALGLRVLTPPGFMKAVSEGSEISAGDAATAAAQISSHTIRVWVFNVQNATPEISRLNGLARARGIPVVTITETLSPASATFQSWQVAQLTELARALREATGR